MRVASAAGWLAAMNDSSKEHIVWAGRALVYLVYFFVTVALIVLTFGFFLLLFGANPDAAFAEWVYRSLDRVMAPFRGLFESIQLNGNSVLDVSVLFAMIVYGIVALALRALIDWLTYRVELLRAARGARGDDGGAGRGDRDGRPGARSTRRCRPRTRPRRRRPSLRPVELGEREHPGLSGDHPGEELRRARHPVDVGDDRRADPCAVVADAEVEPELRVGPQGAGLDLVEVLDHVERPQPAAGLERPVEFGHQHLVVVLALDLARGPEPERPGGMSDSRSITTRTFAPARSPRVIRSG